MPINIKKENIFTPTPIGTIYEEISLLDSMYDDSDLDDFPPLFETPPP